ncbi:hypothetical protein [Promicromonospora sp. NPDC050880]|uniref:hypothetical protein n=1 Tax=Promicromonospora sp. NPDC050880 TaxID=3364406 RepID=UPI00379DFCC0
MEMLGNVLGGLFVPALLIGVGRFVLALLPLVSDRVNARAVALAKAKRKQSE